MALGKNLEEMLKHMEPAAAAAQRKFWEENPAIANAVDQGAVPQAEFNRAISERDEKVKSANAKSQEWKDWADRNKPKQELLLKEHGELKTNYEQLQGKYAELEKKVKSGAAAEEHVSGEHVDQDKLTEAVMQRIGGKPVSEERLTAIVAEEAKKITDSVKTTLDTERKQFFEQTVPAGMKWIADMNDIMSDYREEFGKKLDRADFSKFMTENKLTDPKEAYAKYTDSARREKEIKGEVEKRVNAELSKRNLPGVSSTTEGTELGHMELRIAGKNDVKLPEGSELGDLSAAMAAAKELRQGSPA